MLADKYVKARPKDPSAKIDKIEIYIWAENDEWKILAEGCFMPILNVKGS